MTTIKYRVGCYTDGATRTVSSAEYRSRAAALRQFHDIVASCIKWPDYCVLLSRGSTTLASKSTGQTWVQLTTAYYGEG